MKVSKLMCGAAVAAALGMAVSARASVLLYSFESGDSPNAQDGFAKNGSGITVGSSTVGATDGTGSLELTTTAPNFKGALTTSVPDTLTNPAITGISADVTIPASPVFGGTFADLGVTLFVANPALSEFGEQYQIDPADEQNIDLTPGTHTITIPLMGGDPDSGVDESFAGLLGNGFVVTGFEFFFDENSTNDIFVDNVRADGVGAVPEPTSALGCMFVGGLLLKRRNRKS